MSSRSGLFKGVFTLIAVVGIVIPSISRASITFELRAQTIDGSAVSDPKNVDVANSAPIGASVTLSLVASISNLDNDHSNDGFTFFRGGVTSVEGPSALLGNLSGMSPNLSVVDGLQGGTPQNLDSNPDLELGDTAANANVNTNWVFLAKLGGPKFANGTGTGATEFVLGSLIWKQTNNGYETNLNAMLQPRTAFSDVVAQWTEDGVGKTANYTSPNIQLGAPVHVINRSAPEPGAIAALAMCGIPLLLQRPKRPRSAPSARLGGGRWID